MVNCHICGKDLSKLDIFYHYERNHDIYDIPVDILRQEISDCYNIIGGLKKRILSQLS